MRIRTFGPGAVALLVLAAGGLVAGPSHGAPAAKPARRAGGAVELDRVVAVVGDDVVLMSELARNTEHHPMLQEALAQLPGGASAEVKAEKRRDVEAKVLDELIDIALLKAEAEKFEIRVTDQDLENALENVAKQYGLTVDELRKQVEASPEYGSWTDYREELRDQVLQIKVPNYLATWSVSEAQVREHYRKLTKDEAAKVRVHQFTFTPASQKSEDRDRAFARAQAVSRRLRDGDDPEKIAADLGGDGSETRSVSRGDIAPALEDAIFAAQAKQVVGPLASGQGYSVFKVLEHVESGALSFEQAKERIREQLEREAFLKAEADLRRQLRAKSHIDIRL
jgi:parvulin-like peptidyl-prolyl isomerase